MDNSSNWSNVTNDSCVLFSDEHVRVLSLVRGISGLTTGTILLIIAVIIIVASQIHRETATQRQCCCACRCLSTQNRLFIYLITTAMMPCIAFAFHGLENVHKYKHETTLCRVSAFMVQVTEWSELIVIFGVSIALYHMIQRETRLENTEEEPLQGTRRESNLTFCKEISFLLFAILFPLLFNWVPFLYNDYGESGPWCWIISVQLDCVKNQRGFWEQLGLWYIPFGIVSVLTFVVIVIVFCRLSHVLRGQENLELRYHARGIGILMFYFIVAILLKTVEVVVRIMDHFRSTDSAENYKLWAVYAAFTPISKLILPIALLVYLGYIPMKKRRTS